MADPASARPADVLRLQRAYGNRAVLQMLSARVPQPAAQNHAAEDGQAAPDVSSDIQRQLGSGQALDPRTSAPAAQALNADFSGVRIHTDAEADRLSRSLNAEAFTLGSDIFFSGGAYQPGSTDSKRLLAHELTHVAQQGGSRPAAPQARLEVGPTGDAYEQEAERVADQVTRAPSAASGAPDGGAQARPAAVQRALASRPRLQLNGRKNKKKKGKGRKGGRGRGQQTTPSTTTPTPTPTTGPTTGAQPQSIWRRVWNGLKAFAAAVANASKLAGQGDLGNRFISKLPFKYELKSDAFSGELGPVETPLMPGLASLELSLAAKGGVKEEDPPTVGEKIKKGVDDTLQDTVASGGEWGLSSLWSWMRGTKPPEGEQTQEPPTPETPSTASPEVSLGGIGKELYGAYTGEGGLKLAKSGMKFEVEGSGSAALDLVFGKVTGAINTLKQHLTWAHGQLSDQLGGDGWLAWAASWVDYLTSYVPDWFPGKDLATSSGVLNWFKTTIDGLDEFAKGLKPKSSLSLAGEGAYNAGSISNLHAQVALDVAAFGDEVRGKLAGLMKFFGFDNVATGIETLAGKAALVEFDIPGVDPNTGVRRLRPQNFQAGPALRLVGRIVAAPFQFLHSIVQRIIT